MNKSIRRRIPWEEYFMRHVYLAASKSKDPRTQIGAVIVQDGVIISEGYNGFPRNVQDSNERLDEKEVKLSFIVHAEHNSILNAARMGISTAGSTMFTQGIPCSECAKAIIQAGVKRVFLHGRWPDVDSPKWKKSNDLTQTMFKEAGVVISYFHGELALTGFMDGVEIPV